MKIKFQNTFITDNSNECQNGAYFMQTDANMKFTDSAFKNGAFCDKKSKFFIFIT